MESKTPPDSTPPAQKPTPPETAWISPRLRDKLDDSGAAAPKEGPSPIIGIVLAVLVIGGGAALFATMRSGAAREKAEAARRASEAAAAAAAESTANAARVDSMRQVVAARAAAESASAGRRGTSTPPPAPTATARPPAPPRPSAPAAAAPGAPAAAAAPAAPRVVEKGPFGLDVGSFLAEDRANSELARLSTATGLQGKVIPRTEDGGESYHVVLGSFATRGAADKRAEALVGRALVNQARTVSLAP